MKRLMDRIGETVKGHIAEAKLSPVEDEIRKYILREFARNGESPSPKEIMKELRLSSIAVVHQTLEKLQWQNHIRRFSKIMRRAQRKMIVK